MVCRRSFVSGRVQGVFYRATCVRKAQTLELTGYARNLGDGRVEVLACGEAAAVAQLVAWLWEGSPASKVTAVDSTEADPASIQRTTVFASA
ncbi:MAG: acylphosphatase [Pseudomonadota bacterium]